MSPRYYIVVTPFFPSPNNWRGAYCYDLVKALMTELGQEVKGQGEQWKVLVFVPGAGEDYDYQGVHVYRFKTRQLPCNLFPFIFDHHNTRSFLNKLKEVLTSIVDLHLQSTPTLNPQPSTLNLLDAVKVCHSHTSEFAIYANALKKLNPNCRTLLHHHNCEPIRLNAGRLGAIPLHTDLLYHWQRKNCSQIDLHVFCSEKSRSTYGLYAPSAPELPWHDIREKCLFGRLHRPLPTPPSTILYNGIDPTIFHHQPSTLNSQPVSQPQPSTSTFCIGCIGNFQPLKGHLALLQAIDKIKNDITNLKLRLLGSGEMIPTCRQFVDAHGLSEIVSFETEVDHAQLPDFYRSLDLFVLPSRMEGFCCVYMEAHACGVPFIGCKGISCSVVLPQEEHDFWLAEPNNADSLAEKILTYYRTRPEQHLTRSMKWRDLVREFTGTIGISRGEHVEHGEAM